MQILCKSLIFSAILILPLISYGATSSLQVTTGTGVVEGKQDGPVRTFLGIPYAAPPVGDLVAGFEHRLGAEPRDQAGLLGDLEKLARAGELSVRPLPAGERFDGDRTVRVDVEDRLEERVKLAAPQPVL